jgi:hypothetical protein
MEAGISAPAPVTVASDDEQAPRSTVLLLDELGSADVGTAAPQEQQRGRRVPAVVSRKAGLLAHGRSPARCPASISVVPETMTSRAVCMFGG